MLGRCEGELLTERLDILPGFRNFCGAPLIIEVNGLPFESAA